MGVETQPKETRQPPAFEGSGPDDVTAARMSGQDTTHLHQKPDKLWGFHDPQAGKFPLAPSHSMRSLKSQSVNRGEGRKERFS